MDDEVMKLADFRMRASILTVGSSRTYNVVLKRN